MWKYDIRKQHSNVVRLLRVYIPNSLLVFPNAMLIYTDRDDMKVKKSVSMHSRAFKRSYKCQIVTDTKSRNASNIELFSKAKCLELVSLPRFLHGFWNLSYVNCINWQNYIVWLALVLEILGNMRLIYHLFHSSWRRKVWN